MLSRSRNPLLTFLLSYDVWVTSKIQVNFRFERYWWFGLLNFWNFHTVHVFKVRESIADISTELPCFGDLENPGRLPVRQVLGGTGDCVFVDFRNFFTIYVFEVRESFADIPTELPCLGALKNSGQLPVQEVLEVTQTFLPWQKCSKFISSRESRGTTTRPTLYCQLYCHVTSCHVMSRHATSCHVMSRHVTWRHATLCHVMSRHVKSCQVTSCHVMSHHMSSCHVESRGMVTWPTLYCQPYCHVTSCHVMSRHVTSCHVMSRHVTSCHVMSRHVTLCHAMSRHVTSCHVMSRHVTSCHVMPRHITFCHVMSRHVTSCHVITRHVMSRHVTSWHVMSRYVTSFHVMSRHATSCHVMSRHVTWRHAT